MRDYDEILNSMRICLNVDRDSNCLSECFGCKYITHDHHVMDMVRDAADAIEELQSQRTAFWVDTQPHMDDSDYKKDGMSYYCSACGHHAGKYKHRTYKFCPWCGAKIVEKGEKDDKQYQLHG